MERNPYIQVLVDGDGMIFNAKLIKMGVEGGKQAAAALRNSVLDHCSDLTDQIEIIANIYSNQSGLANAMLRDGSLEDMDHLRDFAVGFTQGKASFNFIDVGHGKERADSKIRGKNLDAVFWVGLTSWQSLLDGILEIIIANKFSLASHTMLDSKSEPEKSCKNCLGGFFFLAWTKW